jgi:hypothetical protein
MRTVALVSGEMDSVACNRHSDTRHKIRSTVRLIKVRVWETGSFWAEYEA